MALSNFSPELPLEILCEIIKFLPLKDLQTLSLASRLTRSLALPYIFGHLRYTGHLPHKIHQIHQARKDVKEVIKKLELSESDSEINDRFVIFQFLETLPNLQVLDVGDLAPACLSQFISSIRHTAVLELFLDTELDRLEGPPTAGLTGLKKFSINWYACDNPNEPGSSLAHLYELIRPSLTTLVELRIDIPFECGFDLQLLKPSTDTLRTFEYILRQTADEPESLQLDTLRNVNESILDTIPAILSHLTKLSIRWNDDFFLNSNHYILWKDTHIRALSKNDNLTDLELSSDFEVNARDSLIADDDYACIVRCYKRRLKATQDIVSACPRLQRCSWVQSGVGHIIFFHLFTVEEQMAGGNLTRVVRGIKQDWMGRDHNTLYRGGGIVKCKLEDLPGDIIGQNDVE